MRQGQLIVLVNGDDHMLKERCLYMIIVVTCFICRNWFRSHQGMMRGRVAVVMVIGILAFVCVSHVTLSRTVRKMSRSAQSTREPSFIPPALYSLIVGLMLHSEISTALIQIMSLPPPSCTLDTSSPWEVVLLCGSPSFNQPLPSALKKGNIAL